MWWSDSGGTFENLSLGGLWGMVYSVIRNPTNRQYKGPTHSGFAAKISPLFYRIEQRALACFPLIFVSNGNTFSSRRFICFLIDAEMCLMLSVSWVDRDRQMLRALCAMTYMHTPVPRSAAKRRSVEHGVYF